MPTLPRKVKVAAAASIAAASSSAKPSKTASKRKADAEEDKTSSKKIKPTPVKASKLQQLEVRLVKGLENVCSELAISTTTSVTHKLASKLLLSSVKELLKWPQLEAIPDSEYVRWAAACVFIVQRSRDVASHPEEVKALGSILGLVRPETLLGFMERCECVCNATDPLVWDAPGMMTSAVKNFARFRRGVALTFTLGKTFEGFFKHALPLIETWKSYQAHTVQMAQHMCWTLWCYLRRRLWKAISNPVELLQTQISLLVAVMYVERRASGNGASSSGAPLDADSTWSIDGEDVPLAKVVSTIYGEPSAEASELSVSSIAQTVQEILGAVPAKILRQLEGSLGTSAPQGPIQRVYDGIATLYAEEVSKDLLGYQEQTSLIYHFEGESSVGMLSKDNCAAWVCQQVNKYNAELFTKETRLTMRACVPNPTDEIERRVEDMVRRFGSHCAPGVSDYRGTTALYSAFFDTVVEGELKQTPLSGQCALMRSDVFHRSLFAVAAHVMGYFSDLPRYPAVLEVCGVQALDFFKAAHLVSEAYPNLLPQVLRARVREAMLDIVYRRGWRRTERFPVVSAPASFDGVPPSFSLALAQSSFPPESPSPTSSSVTPATVSGDGLFLSRVRDETHRMFFELGAGSGMTLSSTGKLAMKKGLALMDCALQDDFLITDRNVRTISLCSMYCSARAHGVNEITFESLFQTLSSMTPPERLREIQMDLSIVELGGNVQGNVIQYYNSVFLPRAQKWLRIVGFPGHTEKVAGESFDDGGPLLSAQPQPLTSSEKQMLGHGIRSRPEVPNVSWIDGPSGLMVPKFTAKSYVRIGLGFTRTFLAHD